MPSSGEVLSPSQLAGCGLPVIFCASAYYLAQCHELLGVRGEGTRASCLLVCFAPMTQGRAPFPYRALLALWLYLP